MAAQECRDLELLLQPYVDGEFEANDQLEVEHHLAHCPECRAQVEQGRMLKARLRSVASEVKAPASLRARIERDLRREQQWAFLNKVHPRLLATIAACAGFLGFVGFQSLLNPLKDAVSHHTHNLPIEVKGDEAHVQSWLSDNVDFNVQLPHFSNASLTGARLSNISDRPAAYVVYDGPKAHRVSLFVFDDPRARFDLAGLELGGKRQRIDNHEVVLANERGYNVALWRDNEIVYSLVSDLDERDIVNLLENHSLGPATPVPGLNPPTPEGAPVDRREPLLDGTGMPQVAPAALHASP
jgi:anti-sigma factor (TIGR02949 family)